MPDTVPPTNPSHFRELMWHTLVRQVVLYFVPLLLLAVFFHVQYGRSLKESRRAHLGVVAEHQAHTLDLFLRERLMNLANLIADLQTLDGDAADAFLAEALADLQKTSDAFVDLGIVGADGVLRAYHGPVAFQGPVSYLDEEWFRSLVGGAQDWLVTNIYLGFRRRPHFTIAMRYGSGPQLRVLRAALSPEKIEEFLANLDDAADIHACVINREGVFQVVKPPLGAPLKTSPYRPPRQPRRGFLDAPASTGGSDSAYAWLNKTPWALVVVDRVGLRGLGAPSTLLVVTVAFFVLMGGIILVRGRQLVCRQLAFERHEAELSGQLVQAAKLASVGELAAGIAHEINNPLAIIAEEAGLLKDSLDPELTSDDEPEIVLDEHLDIIHDAVFRCRDITHKLLTFVRHSEVKLAPWHVHDILDEVLDGMLGNELQLSNTRVVRSYAEGVPEIVTDRNQLVQVFVNVVKNAIDAMGGGGTLTVTTMAEESRLTVAIGDTGCGMTREQLERVFMPFFTTKASSKGTGLGLSVSLTIIKSLSGEMYVESAPNRGSTFTITMPLQLEG
jgi:two-component system, NtrC family, sensor kinase